MAKEQIIDISNFTPGLVILEDTTKAPVGSARVMTNMMISDRGGITKRPGTRLLGTINTDNNGITGFFNYIKSFGSQEILMKSYSSVHEYLNLETEDWAQLESGLTSGAEFGYKEHLVNTDNDDYCYYCNRFEDYKRWSGAHSKLAVALAGSETEIQVTSVLKDGTFYEGTATGSSATTLSVAGTPWASSQWNSFYVYVTSGVHTGKIRPITATTNNQITFDSLGGDPGLATFEIRLPAFPSTGTLIINSSEVAYTALPEYNKFTVASAPIAAIDSPVTVKPTAYPANPRGNRLELHFTRMVIGNVRSALARNSGGTLGASQSTGSYYVSHDKDATDFTFAASRVAGEGDVVSTPLGGGSITDIANQEDLFYIFKPRYIEAASYTQDTNDIIQRTPLKQGVGSVGRVIKGKDDIFFVTATNEITSIGRILQKDIKPETLNIGYRIKRLLDTFDFTSVRGIEYKNRLLWTCKSSADDSANTRVLVYNDETGSFEGVWLLNAYGFEKYNNKLYYAQSNGANVFQMFIGESDDWGSGNIYGISSEWQSNFMNLTASGFNQQSVHAYAAEGLIKGGTLLTFQLYTDFSETPALEFTFGTEDDDAFLTADNLSAFFGSAPMGLQPLGAVSDVTEDGYRRFSFLVYFPYVYGNYFAVGLKNSGVDQSFDLSRFGLSITEDTDFAQTSIKTI